MLDNAIRTKIIWRHTKRLVCQNDQPIFLFNLRSQYLHGFRSTSCVRAAKRLCCSDLFDASLGVFVILYSFSYRTNYSSFTSILYMYIENQRRNVHEAQQNMGQYIYFGTYHISEQRTPRRDCALAQSGQGIRCSHDINHGRRVRRTSAFINLVLQLVKSDFAHVRSEPLYHAMDNMI